MVGRLVGGIAYAAFIVFVFIRIIISVRERKHVESYYEFAWYNEEIKLLVVMAMT